MLIGLPVPMQLNRKWMRAFSQQDCIIKQNVTPSKVCATSMRLPMCMTILRQASPSVHMFIRFFSVNLLYSLDVDATSSYVPSQSSLLQVGHAMKTLNFVLTSI